MTRRPDQEAARSSHRMGLRETAGSSPLYAHLLLFLALVAVPVSAAPIAPSRSAVDRAGAKSAIGEDVEVAGEDDGRDGDGDAVEATDFADAMDGVPAAAPYSFKAGLEKGEVTLADPFVLSVEINHGPEEVYALPDTLNLGNFGVRDRHVETRAGKSSTTIMRLTLQAFAVGELEIPALVLPVSTPRGPRKLELPPQSLTVHGVIDFEQGTPRMREDNRPLPTRYTTTWWPLWALAALAVGVLAALWFRRRRTVADAPPPPTPRLPPFEEAMERIAELEAAALVSAGRKQEYFFRLSEILRDYLGRRFGFDALELTTDELLSVLRERPTPGLDFDETVRFLNSADLVKFARVEATDGECKSALDVARRLVMQTRPGIDEMASSSTAAGGAL